MPNKWSEVPLGEAFTLQRGFDLPSKHRRPGRVPIVSSSGITGYHSEVGVSGPGVVTGRYGTIGQVFWLKEDFWPLNTTLWINDFHGNDPQFASYLLRTIDFHSCSDKSSVPGVNRNDLHRIRISIPPLEEQKAISKVLGSLDEKIELNRRMNATLEEIARGLFQSWFVDFAPVRAKFEGRQPAGLDPATASLFPGAFTDSELGPIPQGWHIKSVGEVVTCVGGGTPSTAEPLYWDCGTHHWATPKDLSAGVSPILLETQRKITDAGVSKTSSGILPAGTLLLSSRAPVGYLALAFIPVAINQGFIAMICDERATNVFMLNWCQARMNEIVSRATGTTFPEISKQNFRPIKIVLPPVDLMAVFTARVMPLYERVASNLRQSRTLANLRDTLLPKLLSGELRISSIMETLP